jgi:uncharacterized OB-fold protein
MSSQIRIDVFRCLTCSGMQIASGVCQRCRGVLEVTQVSASGEVRASTVVARVPPVVLCEVPYGVAQVRVNAGLELQALFAATEALEPGDQVEIGRSSVRRGEVETWTFTACRDLAAKEHR